MTPRQRKRKRQRLIRRMVRINTWFYQLTKREQRLMTWTSGREHRRSLRLLSACFGPRYAWRYRFGGWHDDGGLWRRGERIGR